MADFTGTYVDDLPIVELDVKIRALMTQRRDNSYINVYRQIEQLVKKNPKMKTSALVQGLNNKLKELTEFKSYVNYVMEVIPIIDRYKKLAPTQSVFHFGRRETTKIFISNEDMVLRYDIIDDFLNVAKHYVDIRYTRIPAKEEMIPRCSGCRNEINPGDEMCENCNVYFSTPIKIDEDIQTVGGKLKAKKISFKRTVDEIISKFGVKADPNIIMERYVFIEPYLNEVGKITCRFLAFKFIQLDNSTVTMSNVGIHSKTQKVHEYELNYRELISKVKASNNLGIKYISSY